MELASTVEMIFGALIFCLGLYFAATSIPRHKKEGSNIEPWKPTTIVFTDGIYGRTRNPIYLAMMLGFAGPFAGTTSEPYCSESFERT